MNEYDCNDLIEGPHIDKDHRSGRATWDSRGNSVWEWQTAPGVYSGNVDTQRVKVLLRADLELLESKQRDSSADLSSRNAAASPLRAGANLSLKGNAATRIRSK